MHDWPDQFDITWTAPSRDTSGSMPLGNGDVALNAWVEPSGDLLLLLAKSDAWDCNGNLLKLGRVRIRLSPGLLEGALSFNQTHRLRDATLRIDALTPRGRVVVQIWVDANRPMIRVEIESEAPIEASAGVELWRADPRVIKTQTSDLFKNLVGKNSDPYPTIVQPDTVLCIDEAVAWCHHNQRPERDGYEVNLRLQGLAECIEMTPHPLHSRTFGAVMRGDGFSKVDDRTLRSAPGTRRVLEITALTLHPATTEQWLASAEELAERNRQTADPAAHRAWWETFWQRSWIDVRGSDPLHADEAARVGRAYALQRFMNAAAGRGPQPIKHNGSLFSVGNPDDPDFRRWGPGYWFQNQRLIYWPMLASGDFDLMRPWLAMYRDSLPLQQARTRRYFGHGGAHYPETIYFWGAEVSGHYGWTPFEQRASPEAECAYLRYYWSGGVELSLILLEYVQHTRDRAAAEEWLLPIAGAILQFYAEHYPRDAHGKLRLSPSQSLETWHVAVNPTPDIAGLTYLSRRLIEASGEDWAAGLATMPQVVERCRRMLDELPPLPVGQKDGRRVILPAAEFDLKKNSENPELYCVFPYRLFGLDKPDIALARDTLAARLHRDDTCWHQDVIQMAHLGLAAEARQSLARRAEDACHSESRFPGFWNAFHDWIPDIDHGGVLQIALQSMLMQCEGEKILLLPAWPVEWDARFRLHAPRQTVVEGEVRAGELISLTVTPQSRRGEVRVIAQNSTGVTR